MASLQSGMDAILKNMNLQSKQSQADSTSSDIHQMPPNDPSTAVNQENTTIPTPTPPPQLSVTDNIQNLPRKQELRVFDEENPDGWLFRAERYFDINVLSAAERLRTAAVCLEGDALTCYYWEDGRRPFAASLNSKSLFWLNFV